MNDDSAPAYTRHHWAKFDQGRIHLLEHHLADVGACFEALLAQPTIRQRLARSGGMEDLDESTVARLSVFAALHDIGKANVGFQARVWQDADLPEGRRRPGGRRPLQRACTRPQPGRLANGGVVLRRPWLVVGRNRVLGRPRRRDRLRPVHCHAFPSRTALAA